MDIFLYPGEVNPSDIKLSDPTVLRGGAGATSYSLVCAPGAYSYVGNAATLTLAHSLVCAPGAYSYVGNAATLTLAHSLVCAPGAYSYVGNAATLTYAEGVPAAPPAETGNAGGGGGGFGYRSLGNYYHDDEEAATIGDQEVFQVIKAFLIASRH